MFLDYLMDYLRKYKPDTFYEDIQGPTFSNFIKSLGHPNYYPNSYYSPADWPKSKGLNMEVNLNGPGTFENPTKMPFDGYNVPLDEFQRNAPSEVEIENQKMLDEYLKKNGIKFKNNPVLMKISQ